LNDEIRQALTVPGGAHFANSSIDVSSHKSRHVGQLALRNLLLHLLGQLAERGRHSRARVGFPVHRCEPRSGRKRQAEETGAKVLPLPLVAAP